MYFCKPCNEKSYKYYCNICMQDCEEIKEENKCYNCDSKNFELINYDKEFGTGDVVCKDCKRIFYFGINVI